MTLHFPKIGKDKQNKGEKCSWQIIFHILYFCSKEQENLGHSIKKGGEWNISQFYYPLRLFFQTELTTFA